MGFRRVCMIHTKWFLKNSINMVMNTMIDMMVLEQSHRPATTISQRSYIEEVLLEKLTSLDEIAFEKRRFAKKKEQLMTDPEFVGKYVAVRDGDIVDKDVNEDALLQRIYKKIGYTHILIEKIGNDDFEYTTSPSFDIL